VNTASACARWSIEIALTRSFNDKAEENSVIVHSLIAIPSSGWA
jgi:hypothetical protein